MAQTMAQRILVATGDPQAAAIMRFVLGLGGGEVETVREIDETVNWIRLRPPYDLLVLDDTMILRAPATLEVLKKACAAIPVLWVRRNPAAAIPDPLPGAGAVSCLPEEIASRAQELLSTGREKRVSGGTEAEGVSLPGKLIHETDDPF